MHAGSGADVPADSLIIIRQDADAYDLHRHHYDLATVLYSPRFLFLAGVAFEFCVYS